MGEAFDDPFPHRSLPFAITMGIVAVMLFAALVAGDPAVTIWPQDAAHTILRAGAPISSKYVRSSQNHQ